MLQTPRIYRLNDFIDRVRRNYVALTRGVGPMTPYMSPKGLLFFLVPVWLFAAFICGQCSAFLTASHSVCTGLQKHVNSAMTASTLAKHHHHRTTSPSPTGSVLTTAWASRDFVAGDRACRSERDLGSTALVTSGRRGSRRLLMAGSTTGGARQAGSSGARSINWPLWYVLPIAPYQRRKTLMKEIVPGKVRLATALCKRPTVRCLTYSSRFGTHAGSTPEHAANMLAGC